MKYTKEQLEAKADGELNTLVKEKQKEILNASFIDFSKGKGVSESVAIEFCNPPENFYSEDPDYCNSWADMGPIIQESKIKINPMYIGHDTWCCECSGYYEINDNPLRAAVIVYLLMRGG